jgi:hydrogenase maturation protease
MNKNVLIIGYGNVYCHDDGIAFYVVNALRKHFGLRELQPDEDGLDDLGHPLDAVMLHQLIPEMAPVVSSYRTVFFVDAHTGAIPDEVRVVPVQEAYGFHAVTHHLSPGMLLWMAREATGSVPSAYLISVKGEDFDFGLGLSDPCRARADTALQKIRDLSNIPR